MWIEQGYQEMILEPTLPGSCRNYRHLVPFQAYQSESLGWSSAIYIIIIIPSLKSGSPGLRI
jgi:hypothetical protein